MRAVLVSLSLALSLTAAAPPAFAGSRPPEAPSGFDKPPTNEQIRDKLLVLCANLLRVEDKLSADVANGRCGCYAGGVVKAMTPGELDEMRVTGKFSPSAEPKAKKFMASCKVKT